MKKHFKLFETSLVLCCEEYVYLIADVEDVYIMSKVTTPYMANLENIHNVNRGSGRYMVTPFIMHAMTSAPPRSRMCLYAMWFLAMLLLRGPKDPVDYLFKELVTDGDEVLACLGRSFIVHFLGEQALRRQEITRRKESQLAAAAAGDKNNNNKNKNKKGSSRIFYECALSFEARNDAKRMSAASTKQAKKRQREKAEEQEEEGEEEQHQQHQADDDGGDDDEASCSSSLVTATNVACSVASGERCSSAAAAVKGGDQHSFAEERS